MWKLIYQDTFGFGEDRDPPVVQETGTRIEDGFFQLWTNVLAESVVMSGGKPAAGFAGFSLLVELSGEKTQGVFIDVHRHIERLGRLKQKAGPDALRKISDDHYAACLKNEEESFWERFSRRGETLKVLAVRLSKTDYRKKVLAAGLLMILANVLFLFCVAGVFHLLAQQKTTQAAAAGVFALVLLLINVAFLNIRELSRRYRHPEKFFIEINDENFIHSNGDFIRIIDRNAIRSITEEETISRGGFHSMFVVRYAENGENKSYSFFKASSRRNVVYDVSADQLNDLLE